MIDDLTRIVVLSGAGIIDDVTTAYICDKEGTSMERNTWRKKLMRKHGVWKSVPLQTMISQTAYYTPIAATYLAEMVIHPTTEPQWYQWTWLAMMYCPVYAASQNMAYLALKGAQKLKRKSS